MTRFEKLASVAGQFAVEAYTHKQACFTFANQFIRQFAAFLECPAEAMIYFKVNSDLSRGPRQQSVLTSFPELTPGPDRHWYFGVIFTFVHPGGSHRAHAYMVLGIRRTATGFIITHPKPVELPADDERAQTTLFEELYKDLENTFTNPSERTSRIGFTTD